MNAVELQALEDRRKLFERNLISIHPEADMRRQDLDGAPGYINSCVDWAWHGFMIGTMVEAEKNGKA